MYGIYANIGGILMVNVTIYSSTMDPMGNSWTDLPTVLEIPCSAWLLSLGALGLGTEADLDRHVRLFGHGHQSLSRQCHGPCATRHVVFLMLDMNISKRHNILGYIEYSWNWDMNLHMSSYVYEI